MARQKSSFVTQHGEEIRRLYVEEEYAMSQIAEHFTKLLGQNINTQRIYRVLKEIRVKTRTKNEAQKVALKKARAVHPTKGKELTDLAKQHLSESIAKAWSEISDEERARRAEVSKKQYHSMSDKKKRDLSYAASLAVRKAGIEGSKLEKFLNEQLTELGYSTIFHKKGAIINEKLEIDILIPAQKIAIEVDGIFHTENVFGELGKVVHRDQEKNGLLLAAGYVMIRLENSAKTCSLHYKATKIKQLMECIKKIENEFPPLDSRLIYLKDE